VVAWKLKQWW
jgi:hypothetical protein